MKGKITIERLAAIAMREFASVRQDIAEHAKLINELSGRTARLEEDVKILRRDMESGFQEIMHALRQLREDIAAIDFGTEVRELQSRVGRIEKKLEAR